ncbi:YraN family protein [Aquicoccus sp. G2-2]|uniref:YraN family protein n=1 Tax=Aquicoccus sp. G2-2 TaxID=3092120 RepID=UPI002ADF37EA|nr:YraN family protein [Aquicoccus sp. G2-2]MEA1112419.1 YraN family protein [Aquicoccus sp. G2-2]
MTKIYKESAFTGAQPVSPRRRRRGKKAYHSGLAAEEQIARDYERRGFTVERRRWRGQRGEIDLVIRDGAALVFVEVKASSDFARAAESLGAAQMQRICGAAEEYLAGEPQELLTETRFDVALVNGVGAVAILENAFGQV